MGLKEARAELAGVLAGALPNATVCDSVPERVNAPAVIIRPSDDYVSVAESFGGERVAQLDVILVAKAGRNNLVSDDLDDMIDAVIDGLAGSGVWDRPAVPAPFVAGLGGSNYLCCALQTACVYS